MENHWSEEDDRYFAYDDEYAMYSQKDALGCLILGVVIAVSSFALIFGGTFFVLSLIK